MKKCRDTMIVDVMEVYYFVTYVYTVHDMFQIAIVVAVAAVDTIETEIEETAMEEDIGEEEVVDMR